MPSDNAAMAQPVFCYHHRVTYSECTIGNHVYHARYLDFLETARGEFFRAQGKTLAEWQAEDCILPVLECHLFYRQAARYDDLLKIEIQSVLLNRLRVKCLHRVTNQRGELVLEAETLHVCCTTAEKPRRMPPALVVVLGGPPKSAEEGTSAAGA